MGEQKVIELVISHPDCEIHLRDKIRMSITQPLLVFSTRCEVRGHVRGHVTWSLPITAVTSHQLAAIASTDLLNCT